VQNSIGLVTALNPVLGYEKSAAIAKEALVTNRTVYQLVLEKNLLTKAQLDDILKPGSMTHPRKLASRA
jgi:aspartate ammonia-lyase